MNGPFDAGQDMVPSAAPAEYEILAPEPLLLPGESREQYNALREMILADIAPRSAIERLLALDVAELSWEIRRYRILRHKLLETYRQKAIEASLRCIDLIGIDGESRERAERYTVQNALSWRLDPLAAAEIEARLATYGFDQHALSTEVYLQAREQYLLFENLINSAYVHRGNLLREIAVRRCAKALSRSRGDR